MVIKRGLALAVAFGALTMGCQEDKWYDNWYPETPDVPAADPAYDGSLNFDNAFLDLGYFGCLNSTDDADFIEAFGYDPADMPENFHLWYGYVEFIGVADAGSTLAVNFTDPDTGLPEFGESIYTDYGGAGGAGFGPFAGGDGACDYLAPDGTEDGDYLYCDYFYSDNMFAVDSCPDTLPTKFQFVFNIRAQVDNGGNTPLVISASTD